MKVEDADPWPRMQQIATAVVTGLRSGRFIEETLEALCVQLGASSAWSTLETKGAGPPMHRSRTASFRGVPPGVLAMHVTDVLSRTQRELQTISGPVPYAPDGSFVGVPLWSDPEPSTHDRTLVGAMYLEFPGDQGTKPAFVGLIECTGSLLGGVIAQQSLIENTRQDLLFERSRERDTEALGLEELLASDSMAEIRDELRAALMGSGSIMILGESGTGKTQLATALAHASGRTPIVRAALGQSDDLNTVTSELFGHERGAYSGAVSKRKGLVEFADGGTLIFDEVLNLSPHAQQLLLDFTQFGAYRPLGYQGREPKRADVRIISVTNGDISKAIEEGRFRQDLYYRLAIVPIVLPPLRERRADIPDIAIRYLQRTDLTTPWELSAQAVDLLRSPFLQWMGNIRELESVLARARNRARASGAKAPVIEAAHLDSDLRVAAGLRADHEAEAFASEPSSESPPDRWQDFLRQKADLERLEKQIIEETLAACGGVVSRTARLLSLPRSSLVNRMATLGIEPEKLGYKSK
jgi:DNA-binding NtrC family response regulator